MSIINTGKTCGFLVVRKPEKNCDLAGRGAFSTKVPRVGLICYGGIDRMPWFDVEEDYYRNNLSKDIQRIFTPIKKRASDFTGIELCKDLEKVCVLLEYSNRFHPFNEIIAVYSEKLADIKGTVNVKPANIIAIGYDVVALGWWSLLREGYFTSPDSFPGWGKLINNNGLLSSMDKIDEFVQNYEAVAKKGAVEELPEENCEIDWVEIGRVQCLIPTT